MEKDINRALSDIYVSLDQLQSARQQVEIVTDSNNELFKSTEKLLQEIQKYSTALDSSNTESIGELNRLLNNFEDKLSEITSNGNAELSAYTKAFESQLKNLTTKAKTQLDDNKNSFASLYESNNFKLKETLERFNRNTNSLKGLTEKSVLEVKDVSISELSTQNEQIERTISHIQSLLEQMESLVSYIRQYEIPEKLNQINHKIDSQNRAITKLLYIIIAIISGGGVLMVLKPFF